MKNFLDLNLPKNKPYLVLGKGPSIEKIKDLNLFNYYIISLNHACLFQKSYITHFIDWDVLDFEVYQSSQYFIVPWHPHEDFKAHKLTLEQRLSTFQEANKEHFYWYNCSTWKKEHKQPIKPIIKAKFFSSEALFQILSYLGIQQIFSLGIDGGTDYHTFFKQKNLFALTNGQTSFNKQFKELETICSNFSIDWVRL